MNRIISLILLVVGIILIVYGADAAHSTASSISRTFTGAPTNKAVWLLVAGVIVGLVGLFGVFRGPGARPLT
ncbi:MAG TPA: DUF3185 family protein [Opitutaceae bacterium]|jgi:uncharacterized membrane protein YidH (DUF202 family)